MRVAIDAFLAKVNTGESLPGSEVRAALSRVQLSLPKLATQMGISFPVSPSEQESEAAVRAIASLNKRFLHWTKRMGLAVPLESHFTTSGCFSATISGLANWSQVKRFAGSALVLTVPDADSSHRLLLNTFEAKTALQEMLCEVFPTCTLHRWSSSTIPTRDGLQAVITQVTLRINDLAELEALPLP